MATTIFLMPVKRMLFALLCMLCLACTGGSPTAPLQLTAYNHTSSSIGWYSVEIPGGTGAGAGYLGSGEGGGGATCCVSVPSKWQPGLAMTVTWQATIDGNLVELKDVIHLPEYKSDNATRLSLHFLGGGSVRGFVTRYGLGHPAYPLKGADAKMPPMKL